ncbi:MAG: hypothetical protein EZS28_029910 [Streblomastix strix]|uniref:Uncharacterized protein n=1 Tax=Streblomastix strix TaxID=222440 RepID=A0A5J4UWF6_9EUKA|nr:MAG: hypothetical protein EZS28_029910 [Streblomastix strix]
MSATDENTAIKEEQNTISQAEQNTTIKEEQNSTIKEEQNSTSQAEQDNGSEIKQNAVSETKEIAISELKEVAINEIKEVANNEIKEDVISEIKQSSNNVTKEDVKSEIKEIANIEVKQVSVSEAEHKTNSLIEPNDSTNKSTPTKKSKKKKAHKRSKSTIAAHSESVNKQDDLKKHLEFGNEPKRHSKDFERPFKILPPPAINIPFNAKEEQQQQQQQQQQLLNFGSASQLFSNRNLFSSKSASFLEKKMQSLSKQTPQTIFPTSNLQSFVSLQEAQQQQHSMMKSSDTQSSQSSNSFRDVSIGAKYPLIELEEKVRKQEKRIKELEQLLQDGETQQKALKDLVLNFSGKSEQHLKEKVSLLQSILQEEGAQKKNVYIWKEMNKILQLNEPEDEADAQTGMNEVRSRKEEICSSVVKQFLNITDDEGRKQCLDGGIVSGLIQTIEKQPLDSIKSVHSGAIYALTCTKGTKIIQQIASYKPFPALIRIFEHSDMNIVRDGINSTVNIVSVITKCTAIASAHPLYQEISDCQGIDVIYSLFNKQIDKVTQDLSSICIGQLFRAKEIPGQMKADVIAHLKKIASDETNLRKDGAIMALNCLILNAANRQEINRDGFKIPQ